MPLPGLFGGFSKVFFAQPDTFDLYGRVQVTRTLQIVFQPGRTLDRPATCVCAGHQGLTCSAMTCVMPLPASHICWSFIDWWLSRRVYVPGGLEFKPQRLRGFFGFPGV